MTKRMSLILPVAFALLITAIGSATDVPGVYFKSVSKSNDAHQLLQKPYGTVLGQYERVGTKELPYTAACTLPYQFPGGESQRVHSFTNGKQAAEYLLTCERY